MSELIVVTGPPGAGKSTVAGLIAAKFSKSAVVVGDDFFKMIATGYLDPWSTPAREQNEVVVAAAGAAAGHLVSGGYTVVYDGVIGPWFREAFARATGLESMRYVVLMPPRDVCVDRVVSRSRHGFSDADATRRMYEEFERAHVDDRYVLSTADPADIVAALIFELVRSGSLLWRPGM